MKRFLSIFLSLVMLLSSFNTNYSFAEANHDSIIYSLRQQKNQNFFNKNKKVKTLNQIRKRKKIIKILKKSFIYALATIFSAEVIRRITLFLKDKLNVTFIDGGFNNNDENEEFSKIKIYQCNVQELRSRLMESWSSEEEFRSFVKASRMLLEGYCKRQREFNNNLAQIDKNNFTYFMDDKKLYFKDNSNNTYKILFIDEDNSIGFRDANGKSYIWYNNNTIYSYFEEQNETDNVDKSDSNIVSESMSDQEPSNEFVSNNLLEQKLNKNNNNNEKEIEIKENQSLSQEITITQPENQNDNNLYSNLNNITNISDNVLFIDKNNFTCFMDSNNNLCFKDNNNNIYKILFIDRDNSICFSDNNSNVYIWDNNNNIIYSYNKNFQDLNHNTKNNGTETLNINISEEEESDDTKADENKKFEVVNIIQVGSHNLHLKRWFNQYLKDYLKREQRVRRFAKIDKNNFTCFMSNDNEFYFNDNNNNIYKILFIDIVDNSICFRDTNGKFYFWDNNNIIYSYNNETDDEKAITLFYDYDKHKFDSTMDKSSSTLNINNSKNFISKINNKIIYSSLGALGTVVTMFFLLKNCNCNYDCFMNKYSAWKEILMYNYLYKIKPIRQFIER